MVLNHLVYSYPLITIYDGYGDPIAKITFAINTTILVMYLKLLRTS